MMVADVSSARVRTWIVVIGIAVVMAISIGTTAVVNAQEPDDSEAPAIPATYYGSITINDDPAPEGTTIRAAIDGETRGVITIDDAGEYGGAAAGDPKLTVNGSFADATTGITFHITADGFKEGTATETDEWEPGSINELDLNANLDVDEEETETEIGGNGGGGGSSPGGGTPPQPSESEPDPDGEGEEIAAASETVPVPEADETGERRVQLHETTASEINFVDESTDGNDGSEWPSEITVSDSDVTVDESTNTYAAVEIDTGETDMSQIRGSVTIEIPTDDSNTDELQMYRRGGTDTEWQPLETTVETANDTYLVTGETPGFSTFAVSDVVESEPSANEEENEGDDHEADSERKQEDGASGVDSNIEQSEQEEHSEIEEPVDQPGFTIIAALISILAVSLRRYL